MKHCLASNIVLIISLFLTVLDISRILSLEVVISTTYFSPLTYLLRYKVSTQVYKPKTEVYVITVATFHNVNKRLL